MLLDPKSKADEVQESCVKNCECFEEAIGLLSEEVIAILISRGFSIERIDNTFIDVVSWIAPPENSIAAKLRLRGINHHIFAIYESIRKAGFRKSFKVSIRLNDRVPSQMIDVMVNKMEELGFSVTQQEVENKRVDTINWSKPIGDGEMTLMRLEAYERTLRAYREALSKRLEHSSVHGHIFACCHVPHHALNDFTHLLHQQGYTVNETLCSHPQCPLPNVPYLKVT